MLLSSFIALRIAVALAIMLKDGDNMLGLTEGVLDEQYWLAI